MVQDLRPLMNLDDDDFIRAIICIIASLNPRGPYPIICIIAPSGNGKSTSARIIIGCIDPYRPDWREEPCTKPNSERDLSVTAHQRRVLFFDNLSDLSQLSDTLCSLSTGGIRSERTLYTNDGISVIRLEQPVVFTCIKNIVTATDLRTRCIFLSPPAITGEPKPEIEIYEEFYTMRPRIVGALCDIISAALRNHDETKPLHGLRHADFTKWVIAAEEATGFSNRARSRVCCLPATVQPMTRRWTTRFAKQSRTWLINAGSFASKRNRCSICYL